MDTQRAGSDLGEKKGVEEGGKVRQNAASRDGISRFDEDAQDTACDGGRDDVPLPHARFPVLLDSSAEHAFPK